MHHVKKYPVGPGVALQTPIPLHTTSQKLCFWIPTMGVFEMHHVKKYPIGSGVALQPPIPLRTTSQKLCFWIPTMGVCEMHHVKKYPNPNPKPWSHAPGPTHRWQDGVHTTTRDKDTVRCPGTSNGATHHNPDRPPCNLWLHGDGMSPQALPKARCEASRCT